MARTIGRLSLRCWEIKGRHQCYFLGVLSFVCYLTSSGNMISGKLSILMEKSSMLPCSSVAEAASLYSVDSISCVTVSLTSGSCLAIKMHGRSPPNQPFPVGSSSPGFAYV